VRQLGDYEGVISKYTVCTRIVPMEIAFRADICSSAIGCNERFCFFYNQISRVERVQTPMQSPCSSAFLDYDGGALHVVGTCRKCQRAMNVVVEQQTQLVVRQCLQHNCCLQCVRKMYDFKSNLKNSGIDFKLMRMCAHCRGMFTLPFPLSGAQCIFASIAYSAWKLFLLCLFFPFCR